MVFIDIFYSLKKWVDSIFLDKGKAIFIFDGAQTPNN